MSEDTIQKLGTLYLLPVGLASPGEAFGDWRLWLPQSTRDQACALQSFVVENAKTARASLKALEHPTPLRDLSIQELPVSSNKSGTDETHKEALLTLLQQTLKGQDIGLMSEAGCPAVADPGATLVRLAHELGIPVKPLVGPSALLLALMGSGLDGQRFAFHGYLPARDPERRKIIVGLEKDSTRLQQTQLFIETPYRNSSLFGALIKACQPNTRLCIASNLTQDGEILITKRIAEWKKIGCPNIDKQPTVFLLLG